MGSGVFSVGVSALQVAQINLATTAHNIANTSTDGYSRQRTIQASNIAVLTGAGYVGSGAHVTTIERAYSSTVAAQVNLAQSKVSALDTYSTEITTLDNLLSDEGSSVSSALSSFFGSVSDVSADPSSLTTRQTLVSAAKTLSARFQSVSEQINLQYQNVNSEIQSYVSEVNSYGQRIATLNKQIISAEAANGQPPNDLYDQRDQLVAELNKLVGVGTTANTNGSYNVYFGNGQPLVTSTTVTTLKAVASSEDPSRITIGVDTANGGVELPESLISGGSLGGILQYRSETLDTAANELGRVAASVAATVNAQQSLGQDLLGNVDGDSQFASTFFNVSAPKVVANVTNTDMSVVVSASYSAPSISSDGVPYTNLTTSDYRLQYDGTNLSLTRLSDNHTWSVASSSIEDLNAEIASSAEGDQGFSLSVTGSLTADSSYLIQPTRLAASSIAVNDAISSDVRLVAAAAPIIASASSSNTGSAAITNGTVASGYSMNNVPVTLTYDSASGSLSGFSSFPVTVTIDGISSEYSSDPVPYSSGATVSFDGISFKLSGTPGNGDTFAIKANTNGVSDSRNMSLIGSLQTAKTMAGNTASYATAYSQMISDIGNKASEIDTVKTAQTTILTQSQDSRNSISGVNLDEEAANLIQYQQAYQAASKVLEIASKLFDSILAIGA
ncbi:flagellar hook-associated protein FlgK [Propionivibrio dicarboxylicus]|uniref:Flagellar hook-associated protein 1 n=1 Tax=Propionivibrio dicarboxylicus TaxID=83767 RepID=A0A1G8HE78_9RHOO|nr:flagellar hook-associated protein FlgK [Propionivibrio dicarboxylicus]SDI04943.1 flagellar hook-associated protein 1 FlgK [Propionivibrio dicarboxylicus]